MLLLAKISDERYIQDMYFNEYLFFKSLKEFRANDKDLAGRKDPRELNVRIEQIKYLSLTIDNQEIELSKISSEFNVQYNEYLEDSTINCCSLYSMQLELDEYPKEFDERLYKMGNKILLIYNFIKFFEILDQSLEKSGFEYSRKFVKYYDPKSFNGALTLHHKDQDYFYQNEYRILIWPTECQPIKVSLPGLKEISMVIEISDIKSLMIKKATSNKVFGPLNRT